MFLLLLLLLNALVFSSYEIVFKIILINLKYYLLEAFSKDIRMVINFQALTSSNPTSCQISSCCCLCVHVCVREKESDGITLVMWDQMCSVCLLCVRGRGWSQSKCGITVRISQNLQQLQHTAFGFWTWPTYH